jgi:hypothetical protein
MEHWHSHRLVCLVFAAEANKPILKGKAIHYYWSVTLHGSSIPFTFVTIDG